MVRADVLTLIDEIPGAHGRFDTATERRRQVYCTVRSVGMREAYEAAENAHPGHVRMGRVATGDQFVADKALKETIIQNTGAYCTEMEGAAIAQAAYRNGIPYVILRAISDKADDSADLDYPTFEKLAAANCAAVTEALAKRLAE
mgnify:CR=1 FL=1